MRKAGGGSIINISSLAAVYGLPYGLDYVASKAAVIGMTRGMARALVAGGLTTLEITLREDLDGNAFSKTVMLPVGEKGSGQETKHKNKRGFNT